MQTLLKAANRAAAARKNIEMGKPAAAAAAIVRLEKTLSLESNPAAQNAILDLRAAYDCAVEASRRSGSMQSRRDAVDGAVYHLNVAEYALRNAVDFSALSQE